MNKQTITADAASFEHMRYQVLTQVKQAQTETPPNKIEPKLLGSFLAAYMDNNAIRPKDMAEILGTDEDFIQVMIDGMIPDSLIDDDLIDEMAWAIGYEPRHLRMILNLSPLTEELPPPPTGVTRNGLYQCRFAGCRGHESFSEDCAALHPHNAAYEHSHEPNVKIEALQQILHYIAQQQQNINDLSRQVNNNLRSAENTIQDLQQELEFSELRQLDEIAEQFQVLLSANQIQCTADNNILYPEILMEMQQPDTPYAFNLMDLIRGSTMLEVGDKL